MIVTLAGINLTDDWDIASLSEWWGLPGSRSDVVLRPSGDGAFTPSRTLRDVVRPSARLSIKKDGEAVAAAALSQLKATVSAGLVPLTVDDGTGVTTRLVEVQNVAVSPGFEWWNLPVAVDMIAFDPHRYGPQVCSSTGLPVASSGLVFPLSFPLSFGTAGSDGRVSVANPGSATAFPILTVSGGGFASGFSIVEVQSGRRLVFSREQVAGTVLRFDGRSRRVSVDGQSDVTGALSVAEWPSIPAGSSRTYQLQALGVSSGTPTLQVCVAPAYL